MAHLGGMRAQSSVIGVVLLLGITVASVGVMVTVGADSLDATSQQMELSSAEHAFMQLDSKITLVAHGGSSTQNVNLPRDEGSSLRVDENAGWMNITIVNTTTGEVNDTVTNQTMGALIYRNGDTEIAYQNGGVWRYSKGGSVMVSPPETHYRGNTLTLPMIKMNNSGSISGNPVLKEASVTTGIYPSKDGSRENPLTKGQVNLTVHSKYYEAWGDYFEQRTTGDVDFDHPNKTVTLELLVHFGPGYNNIIGTTSPGGITINGNDDIPEPYETGVNYPSVDSRVEEQISDCKDGSCVDSLGGTLDDGDTYFENGSYDGDLDTDTSDGNVTVVINGDLTVGEISVNGDNKTEILVRGDMKFKGGSDANVPGTPSKLAVLVHSDGTVDFDGSYEMYGMLYAPDSTCDLNGGGGGDPNIKGGVVCEEVDINGNPNDFEYDESVADMDLGIDNTKIVYITYLHISQTNVTVGS